MFIINNTILHQLSEQGVVKIQMMSYIIELPSNHVIVIDGGNKVDTMYLLDYLKHLCKVKPVIDAWFLTHAHSDHIDAFMEIIKKHSDEVIIKSILYNFPDSSFVEKYEPSEAHTIHEFDSLYPKFSSIAKQVKEGDLYTFSGVIFKVLYTPDPTFTNNAINNSSIVLRMEAEGQSVLFLADLGIEAGNKLLNRLNINELHADFVQMAHHGQSGVTCELYKAINPSVCLWNTPQWLWDNDAGKGYNTHTWQTVIVRQWMKDLGVRQHFVTKDGTAKIELPMQI